MVVKLYISGISGNKEVKKKQQRVQMILDSKQISYEAIDITEPGKEKDKEFMQQNGKVRESLGKHPLPPQIFNDDNFCGDYEDFDLANEVDELEKFLHIETGTAKDLENGGKVNGIREEIIERKCNEAEVNGEESHKAGIDVNVKEDHFVTQTLYFILLKEHQPQMVNGITDRSVDDDAQHTTDVSDRDNKMDGTTTSTTNASQESGEAYDQREEEPKEGEDSAATTQLSRDDKMDDESGGEPTAAADEDAGQKEQSQQESESGVAEEERERGSEDEEAEHEVLLEKQEEE